MAFHRALERAEHGAAAEFWKDEEPAHPGRLGHRLFGERRPQRNGSEGAAVVVRDEDHRQPAVGRAHEARLEPRSRHGAAPGRPLPQEFLAKARHQVRMQVERIDRDRPAAAHDITEICSLAFSSRSTSVLRKRSSKSRRHESEAPRRSSARIFMMIASEVVVTVAERWGSPVFARYDISPKQSPAVSTESVFFPRVTRTYPPAST